MSACAVLAITLYVYSSTLTPLQCKLSGQYRKFYVSRTQTSTSLCMRISQRIRTFIMRSWYLISNTEQTKWRETLFSFSYKEMRKNQHNVLPHPTSHNQCVSTTPRALRRMRRHCLIVSVEWPGNPEQKAFMGLHYSISKGFTRNSHYIHCDWKKHGIGKIW